MKFHILIASLAAFFSFHQATALFEPSIATASVVVDPRQKLGPISNTLVAFTFDWWLKTDPHYGQKWQTAGILTADLSNSNLIKLAGALTPSLLRIGGSPEDSITYNVTGTECNQEPRSPTSYYCSQVHPAQYGCLNMKRWGQIITFAKTINAKLAFGLNACFGRTNSTCPESMKNIESLLAYTARNHPGGVYAWELGNELNRMIDPKTWANDLESLKMIVNKIYPSVTNRPILVGPDTGISTSYFQTIVDTIPSPVSNTLAALTYHQYVNCGLQPNGTVFALSCLQRIGTDAKMLKGILDKGSPQTELWIGESAEHSGGGIYGQTNTFASSFFYVYQLSEAAVNGVSTVARQCLMGGYYELVNKTTFEPNPDYWIAYMWRHFVGNEVIGVTVDAKNPDWLYFQSFSGKQANSLTFVIVNFNQDHDSLIDVDVTITSNQAFKFLEYHVTGDVRSSVVMLNDKPLLFKGTFPNLVGKPGSQKISVQPKSIVFVTAIPL